MQYVAFLRGINVGGRVVKMADLKACFEKLGYQHVITLLQTGNVLFSSGNTPAELKQQIESALTTNFSYPAKVQIYSLQQLADIVQDYPFGQADSAQHDYVIFMENGLESDLVSEQYGLAEGEQLATGKGVVYWRVAKGSTLKSDFARLLTKAKYKPFNTNRNLKTLQKLLSKCEP